MDTPPIDDVLTVSDYTAIVKDVLEERLPDAWVRGEISNLRRQSSGHIYFTLKDRGAQLPCVFFRGHALRCNVDLKEGAQVILYGETSVYEPHGRYQLVVRTAQLAGQGRLYEAFLKLKAKLAGEGLFDEQHKKELPSMPLKVAFVTSPTGAAIRDFVSLLSRYKWAGQLHVFPTLVQGDKAASNIAEQIKKADELSYDLIVVGRGGGSMEDLWPFNEEIVVRHIAESQTPIISAVGHQTDFVLSDFAADARAETPTAASEMIANIYMGSLRHIDSLQQSLQHIADQQLGSCRNQLEQKELRYKMASPERFVEMCYMKLDDLGDRFQRCIGADLAEARNRVDATNQERILHQLMQGISGASGKLRSFRQRFQSDMAHCLEFRRERIFSLDKRLKSTSIDEVLKRGFVMTQSLDGQPVLSAKDALKQKKLKLVYVDGTVKVEPAE